MQGSATNHDKPDLRPFNTPFPWPLAALVLALALAMGAYWYYVEHSKPAAAPEPPATLGAPPEPKAEPSLRIVQPAAQPDAPSLPALDQSDSLMREALAGLLGRQAFDQLVLPERLVRRIVATVDNLPRATAPRRMIPLAPVAGAFSPSDSGRYTPYVRVFEAVDERALVRDYARAYPLFQRAYEELGFPGKYFNDRLLQAIDDMLAAPEPAEPPQLLQPKVQYEFADPDLETRSAGQKILLRMGRDHAVRVKAKLRAIRREILAVSQPR